MKTTMHGHGYGRTTVGIGSAGSMMVKVKVTVQEKGASRPHSEGRRKLWLVPVAQVALALVQCSTPHSPPSPPLATSELAGADVVG